jgi:hypothetical protein
MTTILSRILVWTNPSWPIISAITSHRANLDFPNPTSIYQLHISLLEAGHLGGIIRDLSLHNIQCKYVRNNKNIKILNTSMDPRVAASLG